MKGRIEFLFYVSVSVGMALATSAFTMVGDLFRLAGAGAIVTGVVLAALFSVVIALSVGELASMFPSAPGVRTYFKVSFGDRGSLVLVYLYLIFVVLIAGLESFVFSLVVKSVFPDTEPLYTVIGVLVFVVAINLVGFQLPRTMQMLTAATSVLIIVVSGILGILNPKATLTAAAAAPDISAQALALPALIGIGIFLYTGFEWVTPLGMRAKSYERKVPMAMPLSVAILAAGYCLFVIGIASQLTPAAISASPTPQVPYLAAIYGGPGTLLALTLSMVAIISTFNAGIMGGSQLIMVLAHEGGLPRWCASVSLRTAAPIGAILLLGSLATVSAVVVLRFRVEVFAALLGSAIMCFIYAGFVAAALKLRKIRPGARRTFRTPVPAAVQWAVAIALPVVGVQTLLSEPDLRLQLGLGAFLSVALACGLAWRSPSPESKRPRPLAQEESASNEA